MYFNSCYTQTMENMGYEAPDFCKIAEAYGIESIKIKNIDKQIPEIKIAIENDKPMLIQVEMNSKTYIYPKLAVNKPIYNQEPELEEKLMQNLLKD